MTLKVFTIKYRISKKKKLWPITRKVFNIQMRFLLLADINEMVSGQHCRGFTPAKFRSARRPSRRERKIEAAVIAHQPCGDGFQQTLSQHNSLTSSKFCFSPRFCSLFLCLPSSLCLPAHKNVLLSCLVKIISEWKKSANGSSNKYLV